MSFANFLDDETHNFKMPMLVLPNSVESNPSCDGGSPSLGKTISILLGITQYHSASCQVDKHVEYSDQHMGAGHPGCNNIDFKFMIVCTIIIT